MANPHPTSLQTAPHRELRTGGSVIRALLASSHPYRIRGLTRNPSSPAAVALDPSVKVVAADANDPASLGPAFKGAKYVFAMTNFWETLDGAKEEATGRGIVDAAKAAKVELLLWSGVPSAEKVSKGKYTKVHHFDSKVGPSPFTFSDYISQSLQARISEYAQQSGVPTISVEAGFYAANLHTLPIMTPQKVASLPEPSIYKANHLFSQQEDGSYVLTLPVPAETKVALIDTEADYGLYVGAIILPNLSLCLPENCDRFKRPLNRASTNPALGCLPLPKRLP